MVLPFLLALALAPQPKEIHLTIDSVDRLAYVFAPSQPPAGKPPVLFMFHGHGGSAQTCMRRFYAEKRWPQAVVVYCDGLPVETAGGNGKGWQLRAAADNRDLKFFDALLPKVLDQFHADPHNVFAWGFSNGGMFVYTLWATRADRFAAFCASGAAIINPGVRLTTPEPAFITISGNDPVVPTDLQETALKQAEQTDGSQKTGKQYGDSGTYFAGKQPIVVWRFNGGHEFPSESFPKLIEFFRSIADGHPGTSG